MLVNGIDYRTIRMEGPSVYMIDQNLLPFEFRIIRTERYTDTCEAIRNMTVRGAGAIGAAAGFAMAQACLEAPASSYAASIEKARIVIESTRPTARNLFYAVERVFKAGMISVDQAIEEAQKIADEDSGASRRIGEFGSELIREGFRIATHCNAGWLAFVDYGTALSPVYHSFKAGKKIFVYADETRPRGQGARLTAWELHNAGIPHAIIPDNATAWYMAQGKIDLVIVGADRIAANGDTANKIGTLEKAIAAKHYGIPFFVAAPASTFDPLCPDGSHIAIEERNPDEVLYQEGLTKDGKRERVLVCSPGSPALNPAFDVTPAGLISGYITEQGVVDYLFRSVV
ncbi:MAG: S-methyl-5-thioribose-1-phosphate isomerase [Bacteroidales bacterium]|nr:S-methyl-5-thioribose-1-phosphate isomerase [Bacteroidales bacterium]